MLVVGGGITGALIADALSHHGHEVAVIEQRDIGWGSTAASTALLQYEIDTHLLELAQRYGRTLPPWPTWPVPMQSRHWVKWRVG